MSLPPEIEAIRTTAAYSRSPGIVLIALRGDDARDALLHLCPSRLFLRDAQVKESLLLSPEGRPIADVLVCADDEDYVLMVEGLSADELRAHVEANLPDGVSPDIVELGATHEVISLHGPWAWNLAAAVLGPDLVALPYLNLFRVDPGGCVRAGKTGEFGYDLVLRRSAAEEVWASVTEKAVELDAREVGRDALSICRFENWFFDPAHVPVGVTPLELQLSWRLDMDRDWVGRSAVDARLAEGVKRRLTCMLSRSEVAVGDGVFFEADEIGTVVRAEHSPCRDEWVVAALLDVACAQGGIDRFRVGDARAAVLTVAPPLIDNRSLYVDPRRHTWDARDEIALGPLVRGPRAPEAT